ALGASEHGSEIARQDLEQRGAEIQSRRAAVAASEATVRSARADYDRTKLDRDRIAALVKNGLVAQQDMDHAESAYQTAAAALDAAQKRLDQARSDVYQSEASQRSQRAAV